MPFSVETKIESVVQDEARTGRKSIIAITPNVNNKPFDEKKLSEARHLGTLPSPIEDRSVLGVALSVRFCWK